MTPSLTFKECHRAAAFAACLFAAAALWLSGCHHNGTAEDAQAIKTRLDAAPPAFVGKGEGGKALWDQTKHFYALREDAPAWIAGGKANPQLTALMAMLSNAGEDGLQAQDYASAELQAKVQSLARAPDGAVDLELYSTYLLMKFSSDVAVGHPLGKQIDPDWSITPRQIDLAELANQALVGNTLAGLPVKLAPPHPEYLRLKETLKRYRQIEADNKLQLVPGDLPAKLDANAAGLPALKNDLLILGDLKEKPNDSDNVYHEDLAKADVKFSDQNAAQPAKTPDPQKASALNAYDADLADAVSRFQRRHGLNPDGIPNAAMVAAINVPIAARVRQIELNMERWRWMQADFGSPYIFVNVPGYSLQVRDEQDAVPLKMRAIVGKETDRTPIFSGTMNEIVFSPYWNIPQSIELKEMLPAIAKNRNYLSKKEIEVVRMIDGRPTPVNPGSVKWGNPQSVEGIKLRQKPGDQNALGHVKFIFPNAHDVYIHDTPGDTLFDKLGRDLSHGCIRVEEPTQLAAYVLRDQPDWTPERIDAAMHAGSEDHVALKNPLPVHIVYLTVRVDTDGLPQFFDDAYGYDQKQAELTGNGAQ